MLRTQGKRILNILERARHLPDVYGYGATAHSNIMDEVIENVTTILKEREDEGSERIRSKYRE